MTTLSAKPKIFKIKFTNSRTHDAPPMAFNKGDMIEVCSKQDGFNGSYYEATVVAKITRNNQYVVEYKTLVEDDFSEPLREIVAVDEVRPRPSPLDQPPTRFFNGDRVDAFDNDGWWVGTINGMDIEGRKYNVYFEFFMVEIAYDPSKIRVHQDWDKGKWSVPSVREY